MTILVTGGAGFIGSNFIPFFLESNPEIHIVNLDLLTYAGDLENLREVEDNSRYHFIKGDINDPKLVNRIFKDFDIRGVINFAAESHVDNSIKNPEVFIHTNVNGTFNLLHNAFKHWMEKPGMYKKEYLDSRFHQISTDEVYGSLGETGFFTEKTSYAPNSPYSASKASADMLVRSYHHTYGLNTIITNCSNNYGPKQHKEKLIPTIIRKALNNKDIPIYGDGKNVRDWLYVKDHCRGIAQAFLEGQSGKTYNIGGGNERDNNFIATYICGVLDEKRPKNQGSYKDQIIYVEDRAGHDRRYAIDSSKIEKELGWQPEEDFQSGILKSIEWYLNHFSKV